MRTMLLLLMIILASCNITGSDAEKGPVSLRIQNTGDIDFQSVRLSFTGQNVNFGKLAAGQISDYQLFEKAYHYGFIEVEAEDTVYSLVPVDYVGESPLKPGQYTYELKIVGNDLVFRFEE